VRVDAPEDGLRVLVDGEERAIVRAAPAADIRIGGLSPSDHVVRLEKMAETQGGSSRLLGFSAAGGVQPVRARSRQVEFVGDSYTVGYGNASHVRTCSPREIRDRTDSQTAFGPVLARRLGADYRLVAYSGHGVVRNYGGGVPGSSLPVLYGRAVPGEPAAAASDPGWRPQLIVINLGTNDFSTPLKAGERWRSDAALRADYRTAYRAFINRLRRGQPQARFVLMAADAFAGEVGQVAAALNRANPGLVTTLRFGGLELTGCDYHPSLGDHAKLANALEAHVGKHPPRWPAQEP
jgi:lysophospholipase L1-like esterase